MLFSKRAAALRYIAGEDAAPRIVAKGRGYVAAKIIEAAEQYGVPVREDDVLAALLDELELNTMIPAELYTAVAEVLALIYRLERSGIDE